MIRKMTPYMTTIESTCVFCHKAQEVEVPTTAFMKWQEGALIQKVMPEVSAETREFLISRICPTCQEKVFG
jgi:hypothetical protein